MAQHYRICSYCDAEIFKREICGCREKKEEPRCNANSPRAKPDHGFFPNILTGWGPSVKSIERGQNNVKRADAAAR